MGKRQEKWIMVRLKRETHAKLLDVARRFQDAGLNGRHYWAYHADRHLPSINDVVAELMRRDLAHGARSRKSRKRKEKPEAAE